MVDSRMNKVFVTSVAALLLLSSVVFLAGSQADASDDLQITDAYAPDGTPPPRQNIEYDYLSPSVLRTVKMDNFVDKKEKISKTIHR